MNAPVFWTEKLCGAKADVVAVTSNVTIAAGSPNLTVDGATFIPALDMGKLIVVPGAGASGGDLSTTISSVTDDTHVVLSANAGTALSAVSKTVTYGTDDSRAIQNAVTQAILTGSELCIPGGNYALSMPIKVNSPVTLRGINRSAVTLTLMTLTADCFDINTSGAVSISNMTLTSGGKQTGGAMVKLSAPGGENYFSEISKLVIQNAYVGIDVVAATYYKLSQNYITAANIALHIRNTFNADHGDGDVSGNTLLQDSNTGTGVLWESGGGLRFIGNKINGYFVGMLFNQASNGSTSILLIGNNSIENQGQQGICFARNGSATLWHVVISDNHFAGTPLAVNFSTAQAWPINIVLEGNVVLLNSFGQQGFNIGGGSNLNVGPNAIYGGGAPSNSTGIIVGSAVTNGQIGFQAYNNLTTNIINNSPGVAVH